MTGQKTGLYWRICWGIITPGLMLAVLTYTLVDMKPLTYKNVDYPHIAHGTVHFNFMQYTLIFFYFIFYLVFGWCLSAFGLLQIPGWLIYQLWQQTETNNFKQVHT